MRHVVLALIGLALVCPAARAHDFHLGHMPFIQWDGDNHAPDGWLDGDTSPPWTPFHFGGRKGGFDLFGFGLLGHGAIGFPGVEPERFQMRFETRFDDLMSQYETEMSDTEDYYQSEEYMDLVDDTKVLADRYDLFLDGANRRIDRLGDSIDFLNDDVMHYMDLISEYEVRDDLPENYLDHLLTRLSNTKDHLTTKIDWLTDQQTLLTDNLGTYEMFSSDLSMWLDEIVAAGEMPIEVESLTALPLTTLPLTTAALSGGADVSSVLAMTDSFAAPISETSAVPEPAAGILFGSAALLLALRRRRKGRA